MDDMTRSHHSTRARPRARLPTSYSDAGAGHRHDADARPGLEPVTVGTGPLTIDEVVRVARDGAPVVLAEESLAEVRRTREVIRGLADDTEPHYGVSTGFGALATRHIPVAMRRQLQRSLVRSHAAGSGPEVEREVVRALMLLRISTLATGRTGIREETLTTYVAMLNAGITPVVHEYGSLGCSGDLAPLSHCALALMGEGVGARRRRRADAGRRRAGRGRHRARRAGGEGGPGPHQRHRRHARHAVPRHPRPARAARGRRRRRGDVGRGAARHRRRVRRRPARPAPPARPGRVGREHPKGDGAQRDPRVAPHRGVHPRAGRLLAALRPAGRRRGPRHRRPRRPGRRLGARLGRRQPGRHPRRPGRVQRQLPRRAGRLRARLPRDRRRRRRLDLGAPHRPVPRRRAQPRPAAVPRRRPRRRQRAHDRAVHPGRDRLGDEAAGGPGIRRLDPELGDAGGPRVDGLVGGPQAAPRRRRALPRAGGRGAHRRPRHPAARAAHAGARHRRRRRRPRWMPVRAGPGPDRWLSPEIDTAHGLVLDGTVRRAAESETGPLT